jgi:UDP-glucose 4-epimerase
MKIAVTGSDSFLAYHLIINLIKKGHQVFGYDLKRGRNSQDLLNLHKDFNFFECDVTNFKLLKEMFSEVDCVYHLASISSERLCRENPLKSFEVNIKGTLNTLLAAKEKKTLFIFVSSGSVYPDSSKPKKEEEAGFSGKFYGTSKLVAEKYCQLFGEHFSFPFVILRFSRLYGPRMKRNPIYDITKGLVSKSKIILYEGLKSNYDFIFVEDAVRALIGCLDKKWGNGIFNISSGRGIELKNLVSKYFKIVGFEIPLEIKCNVSQTDILDNTKAVTLGFKLKTQLEEGLKQTFLYFSKEHYF